MTARIIGTGRYLPENIVTNDDLSKIVDTSDEWIVSHSGIRKRRIATDVTTSQMATKAAEQALENAGISAEEIDLIILATMSPNSAVPNCSCQVQAALGADKALCFDLNSACSGFLFALNTAYCYIQAGMAQKAIVIGAETISKSIDWSDRNTCILFGDGAGAAVVCADEVGIEQIVAGADGSKGQVLKSPARPLTNFLTDTVPETEYLTMGGREVYKFAVTKEPECIRQVLDEAGLSIEDIDLFVLHQANERILQSVAKRLKVDIAKFPMNLNHYGNTSAASIPILLDELNRDGKLKKGMRLILSGFGGGLTWGATILTW